MDIFDPAMTTLNCLTPKIFVLIGAAVVTTESTNVTNSLGLTYEWTPTTTSNEYENHTTNRSKDEPNSRSLSREESTSPHYGPANKVTESTESTISRSTEPSSTSKDYLQMTTSKEMAKINWSDFMRSNESQNLFQKPTNSSFSLLEEIPPFAIPLMSFFIGIVVITFNSLVMVASVRNRKLRQNTNYNLVMGLALSDFLMGVCAILVGVRLNFSKFTRIFDLCIVTNIFALVGMNMSLFQTLCISLHRYLVLSENDWAKHIFDNNRKYYLCIFGWVTSFTIYSSFISPEEDRTNCFYRTIFGPNMMTIRLITCVFISSFMFLIAIFYSLAIYQVRRRYVGTSNVSSTGQMEDRKKKRIMKATKLVSMILLALVVFSGPMLICSFFSTTPRSIVVASFAAANVNSLLNPIIYCSHITQLRNELKSIFCCKEKK